MSFPTPNPLVYPVHGLDAVRDFLANKFDASKRSADVKKEKKAERKRNKKAGEAATGAGVVQEPAVVVGPSVTEQASSLICNHNDYRSGFHDVVCTAAVGVGGHRSGRWWWGGR